MKYGSTFEEVICMEYTINILAEFKDQKIEDKFREGEIREGLKIIRYVTLFSTIINLLFGIPDYLFRKDVITEVLVLSGITRIGIFILGIVLFIALKKVKDVKVISRLIFAFAFVIYAVHIYVAFYFAPLPIMFETFNLVILSTCIFVMPNRWILNLCFSLACFAVYLIVTPQLCATASLSERIITIVYIFWNTAIVSILFYSINIYKRNAFTKALQLEELANTDQLTKINNRKSCDDILESTCRENMIFSVIMFDIDNFKLINDTYGHVVGDDVIVNIINVTRKIIRKDDILARWGGEEFVVVMPDATLHEATELAKRVKEHLELIKHDRIKQSVTCSFGVTAFVYGENAKSVIGRADQLLYLAKEYGKNRVVAG